MVYSHKTHALAKLEVENVLSIGILILIAVNSQSLKSATVVFSTNKTYIHVLYICQSMMLKKREKKWVRQQTDYHYADW